MATENTKELICIMCPVGCRMTATQAADGEVTISGNGCGRGVRYGKDEFIRPMRMVTSSVWVQGGAAPLVSVKTSTTVPKASIDQVLEALKTACAKAPVAVGDVVIANVAGTGADIVATRVVAAKH